MTRLQESGAGRTAADGPAEGLGAAEVLPEIGQDPGSEPRSIQVIVQLLNKAVAARHLYASAAAAGRFLDQLEGALEAHLGRHQFLRLPVGPQGFAPLGVRPVRDDKRDVAEGLARDGVVELLFKRGVTRAELGRLSEVLHATGQPNAGGDSAPTRLWEADLEHVVFRCRDEIPPLEPEMRVHGIDETPAPGLDRLEFFGLDVGADAPTRLPAARLDTAPRRLGWKLEEPAAALEHLARTLVELQASEPPGPRAEEARQVLGELVQALLAERRLTLVRDVLADLRARVPQSETGVDAALDHVLQRLCAETNVLRLGGLLDDAEADADQVAAAREVLTSLPAAVEPLCTLLSRLESMQARKLVCHVLATVAASDPSVLSQRAYGEPWYVARNMIWVMGRIATPAVLPFLKRWSGHEDVRVRVEVARSAGKVRASASPTLLCDLLNDPEPRVRQTAVWSLATLGDARALPRLRHVLFEERSFRSRRSEERDDFFRTYGRLADEAAYQELVRLVEQRPLVGVGWHNELRRGAALALGEMKRPEALELLQRHTGSRDARLREACQAALRAAANRGGDGATAPDDDWPRGAERRGDAEDSFHLEVSDDD
jgi:HEAT repeat protein